jgi:P-type Cu2+ transporter
MASTGTHGNHQDHNAHPRNEAADHEPSHSASGGSNGADEHHGGAKTQAKPPRTGDHAGHAGHADSGGHAAHTGHAATFRDRFWVALVLTIPLVVLSEMVQDWFGYSVGAFPGKEAVPPVLGTVVFAYGGWPFLAGARNEIQSWRPGMMLLISLAIGVAFVASIVSLVTPLDFELWWELATLVTIMLFGHWMEMRALGQAQSALAALAELIPDQAERVTNGGTEQVPVAELQVGDVVLVRPGSRVPVDGEIVEGHAELDESVITGESRPVSKVTGDRVVAGSVAAGASLRVRVSAVGDDTALAGIHRMIEQAQGSKSRTQVLADRAAGLLFYVAIVAGTITMATWGLLGQGNEAVVRTVTVLVIACPHALGLAIPLVVSISTGLSAKAGILVKDRLALERMRLVDTVLFDKTGTLTLGQHRVSGTVSLGQSDEEMLRLAGAAERDSEHPLARAIVRAAEAHGPLPESRNFRAVPGRGVYATVEGRPVAVGGPGLLSAEGLDLPAQIEQSAVEWKGRGASILYVVRDGDVVGALALEDEVRPESREVVRGLQRQGLDVAMITGDAVQVAESVASELGIDEVFAEVLPEDKDKAVAELQQRGRTVAMVGDGVNDAPALARADVGIAIGAGTDVAIASAGMVLASDDPRGVLSILRLSRAGYRKMIQNLGWAAGYNVVALPLAAGVLAPVGITLAPAVGALLMSISTVIVALNAQLLRRTPLQATGDR